MNVTPPPPRDYLVLKVAAGVVVGGLILGVIANVAGVIVVNPALQTAASPAPSSTPAVSTSTLPTATVVASSPPQPTVMAASPKTSEPGPGPAASTAQQASPASPMAAPTDLPSSSEASEPAPGAQGDMASTAAAEPAPADQQAQANRASAKADTTEPRPLKLLPVPDGMRCIEGRLFRVLPNGFEQVTDGSEKRYCP